MESRPMMPTTPRPQPARHHHPLPAGPRPRGFTLTELMVVIAVIALVVGLVVVAVPKVVYGARSSVCQGNQRSLAQAANTYAASNKGRLPSPRTDAPGDWPAPNLAPAYKHYWVAATGSNLTGSPARETDKALQNGSLFPYVGNISSYRSPQDPTSRLRSYSLNGFVGVEKPDDTLSGAVSQIPAAYRFDTRTLSRIPQPSRTLFSVVEWDRFDLSQGRDYNFNGFLVNPEPSTRFWFDLPAMWNDDRINVSYVDGSTGQVQLFDKSLLDADQDGHDFTEPPPALDYEQFRRMMLPGLIN
ncbi:MAG: prepilin-type N-terminal cleavage/methylation domain-containing protein [Phycisphaerales bacterium]